MTVEFIAVPIMFIVIVVLFVFLQKSNNRVKDLQGQLSKSTENIIKQHSVIELMKGNRCGKHVFDIEDRVVLIQHLNPLSHRVIEISIKKNRETMYQVRLQDRAMWAPEHTLKLFTEQGKD